MVSKYTRNLFAVVLCFFLVGSVNELQAQFSLDTITLSNPSFEDRPQNSVPPKGWRDCGFRNETPPDVHPINPPSQGWHVTMEPQDGNTYMGMVVRDNDTWERVSQRVGGTLEKGKCYSFSIWLARSPVYVSPSHITRQITNYTTPTVLRIWGGNYDCDRAEMLGESPAVSNTSWREYFFQFNPGSNFDYIMLEAFYETPTLFPYNGNLLLDNASHIIRIPCNESETQEMEALLAEAGITEQADDTSLEEEIAEATRSSSPPGSSLKSQVIKNPDKKQELVAKESAPRERSGPPVRNLGGYHKSQLKEGQLIRINRLYFDADAYEIKEESFDDLNLIAYFLIDNPEVSVEIGGHTNDLPSDEYCYRLSRERARAVTNYLISQGVDEDRLTYRGYGKRQPVATNKTAVGRRMNQRVEIKILKMGGQN